MTANPAYALLMQDVTEELERKVLGVLIEHAGEWLSRPDLVFHVFGVYVQPSELANNKEDRKIREAIGRLQRQEYPIMASSGETGYVLSDDDASLDKYIGEIVSRQNKLLEKERALRRSRKWIKFIREYKFNKAEQPRLFNTPRQMP